MISIGHILRGRKLYWPSDVMTQIGFSLTALIPFFMIVSHSLADAALSCVALLFLGRCVWKKDWQWAGERWFILSLVIWVWLLFISFFAVVDPGDSFGRALPWIRFILFIAALKHWVLRDDESQKTLALVVGCTLLYVVLETWIQYATGFSIFGNPKQGVRLTGPFDDKVVGLYIAKLSMPVMGLIVLFLSHCESPARIQKTVLLFGLMGALLLTVLITGERIAFLSLGLAMLIFILSLSWARRYTALALVFLTVSLGAFVTFSPNLYNRVVTESIKEVGSFSESHYGIIFSNAYHMIVKHPYTGAGLKNFRAECQKDGYNHYIGSKSNCGQHPHNPYLEWAAEAGLPGLSLFLVLMVIMVKRSIEAYLTPLLPESYDNRAVLLGLLAALVIFLWPFKTSMSLFTNANAVLFWYVLGWAYSFTAKPSSSSFKP